MTSPNPDKTAALVVLYQTERAETLTLLNINIALVGAELAYAAATMGFYDKLKDLPAPVVAALPIPLWLGLFYNVIIIALSGRHGAAVLLIEKQIYALTGMPASKRVLVGSYTGEYVVNPLKGSRLYRPALFAVYSVPWLLVFAYTAHLLLAFARKSVNVRGHTFHVFLPSLVVYGLLLVIALLAFIKALVSTPQVDP